MKETQVNQEHQNLVVILARKSLFVTAASTTLKKCSVGHRLLIWVHWICVKGAVTLIPILLVKKLCPRISWVAEELYSLVCLSLLSSPTLPLLIIFSHHWHHWFFFFLLFLNPLRMFPPKVILICYILFLNCSIPSLLNFVFFLFVESYHKHLFLFKIFIEV